MKLDNQVPAEGHLISLYDFQKDLLKHSGLTEPQQLFSRWDWFRIWARSFYDSYRTVLSPIVFMVLPLSACFLVIASLGVGWAYVAHRLGEASIFTITYIVFAISCCAWLLWKVFKLFDTQKNEDLSFDDKTLTAMAKKADVMAQAIGVVKLLAGGDLKSYFDRYANPTYVETEENIIPKEFWRRKLVNVMLIRGVGFFVGHPDVDEKRPDKVFFRKDLLEVLLQSSEDEAVKEEALQEPTDDLMLLEGAEDVFASINSYEHEHSSQKPKNKVIRGLIRTENVDSLERFLKDCLAKKLVVDDRKARLSLASILALAIYRKENKIDQSDTTNLSEKFKNELVDLKLEALSTEDTPEYFKRFLAVYAQGNKGLVHYGQNQAERAEIGRRAVGATNCDHEVFKSFASHFVEWLKEDERLES